MYATPLDGSGNHYLRSNLMVSSHYSLVYISDAACPGYWIQHEVWCGHSMNPAWARACLMSSAGYRVTSPLLKVQHGMATGLSSTSWKTRRSHLIQLKSSIATPLWVSDIQKTNAVSVQLFFILVCKLACRINYISSLALHLHIWTLVQLKLLFWWNLQLARLLVLYRRHQINLGRSLHDPFNYWT